MSKYDHLTHDELVRLLEARDRRDATRFGLVWEANEIERDQCNSLQPRLQPFHSQPARLSIRMSAGGNDTIRPHEGIVE